ncbi:oligoribonuclease-like isoform X2 [Glycine soja]|uniref:oligoribonuclease-like isoform X2 n=1 Tax=Glycine soja TaxID=3848 RepID=UPI00103F50BD|nr:oligoribonuclease-like isoform X2 [Glycine soja]
MEKLANSFSVLELDADDSHVPTTADISDKRVNADVDIVPVKSEKQNQENPVTPSCEYKLPLVWIDLEMTGLNIEVDRILEIACIITDGNLTKTVEGPDLVIHQTKECLDRMGEWCQSHHAASGLTKKVLKSTISEGEAEEQKYMPKLASLFSHVLVDVSSVKALCIRWYPKDQKRAPSKLNRHRALDDIRESIEELRYYKANIFKPKSRKS